MSIQPWESDIEYEILINDVVGGEYTGEFISLTGDDALCGVRFDGVGSPDLRDVTYELSGGDGVRFGIEHYGAVNWTITGAIHGSANSNTIGSPDDAWNSWSRLARAWIGYPGRTQPRAVVPLYVKRPGREQMVIYGRPRRIDPDTSNSYAGYIGYTALFQQSDPRFYAAKEKSITVAMAATTPGEIKMNTAQNAFLIPFVTSSAIRRPGAFEHLGDANTNPVISFHGPVLNPTIYLYNTDGTVRWTAQLTMSVQSTQVIQIDTQQWNRTITDQYGTSFAGYYRGVRLQDLEIPPGNYQFDFQGIDETGTSRCEITFRDAWSST